MLLDVREHHTVASLEEEVQRLLRKSGNSPRTHDLLLSAIESCGRSRSSLEALGVLCEGFRYVYLEPADLSRIDDVVLGARSARGDVAIIASVDPLRRPSEGEVVICYGEYPLCVESLAHVDRPSRHLRYFWDLRHDVVEFDRPAWERVDQIFVINLAQRVDRWHRVLAQLAKVAAPLHRVTRVEGVRNLDNPSLGCADSHLMVAKLALEGGYERVLVLEDDFTFIDAPSVSKSLTSFFERAYDFDVCLLATSRFFERIEKDDLLDASHQECTTASGYLVHATAWPSIVSLWEKGRERLESTKKVQYACDRTWAPLQRRERFFAFRKKLGFQATGVSSISGEDVDPMD